MIQHSSDGGITWAEQTSNTDIPFFGVHFLNESIGWVVGMDIYHTTNGGSDWIKQTDGIATEYDVDFADLNHGKTCGVNGIIYGTTNGGTSWIKQTLQDSAGDLRGVTMIDENNCWVVGGGRFRKTTDGGVTWITQSAGSYLLNDITFTDINNGWVVGDDGIILHTTNGGVSFVEEEQINEIPTEFLLSQNYPNPFNPTTNIQYAVSSRQFVTLKVYDKLGREVATLVSEEKPAGEYEVVFDGSLLTSGVYLYRLTAGDPSTSSGQKFCETKKLVLLK